MFLLPCDDSVVIKAEHTQNEFDLQIHFVEILGGHFLTDCTNLKRGYQMAIIWRSEPQLKVPVRPSS